MSSIKVTVLMHSYLAVVGFEHLTHMLWLVLYGEDADVGVQHELEHQNDSRS